MRMKRVWEPQAALLLGCSEPADAEACCRRALRIREDLYGPESREVSAAKCTLADALRELDRCDTESAAFLFSCHLRWRQRRCLAPPYVLLVVQLNLSRCCCMYATSLQRCPRPFKIFLPPYSGFLYLHFPHSP
jgi:hypothetical protein